VVIHIEIIEKVLQAYGVHPVNVYPITDRVYRISDGKQEYALKESSLTEASLKNFQSTFQMANQKGISSVLPVYLTTNHEVVTKRNDRIYYLSPWVDHSEHMSREQSIRNFYQIIGSIHGKTKQSEVISTEQLTNFDAFQQFLDDAREMLRSVVNDFEKMRFMSPFELLVCTQYRDVEQALAEATRRIEQFLQTDEKQLTWNISLNHGNLSTSHVLHPYLINWENAHFENASRDLAQFFLHETIYYDHPGEMYIDTFSVYMTENKLTVLELQLLTIYLLNPGAYLTVIHDYQQQTSSIVTQIKQLQQAYRNMMFGLTWSYYIESEYESINPEDMES